VARAENIPYDAQLLQKIKNDYDPPAEIDFRMSAKLEKKK
jgi:hypothetical protein